MIFLDPMPMGKDTAQVVPKTSYSVELDPHLTSKMSLLYLST